MNGTFRLWDTSGGRDNLALQSAALDAAGEGVWPEYAAFSPDGRQLVTITGQQVLPPITLHAFPWDLNEYPGAAADDLTERVEQYKRGYWTAE